MCFCSSNCHELFYGFIFDIKLNNCIKYFFCSCTTFYIFISKQDYIKTRWLKIIIVSRNFIMHKIIIQRNILIPNHKIFTIMWRVIKKYKNLKLSRFAQPYYITEKFTRKILSLKKKTLKWDGNTATRWQCSCELIPRFLEKWKDPSWPLICSVPMEGTAANGLDNAVVFRQLKMRNSQLKFTIVYSTMS